MNLRVWTDPRGHWLALFRAMRQHRPNGQKVTQMNDDVTLELSGPLDGSRRGWEEQWLRTLRWLDDVKRTYNGRPATEGGLTMCSIESTPSS
jgi:hypothetical protein